MPTPDLLPLGNLPFHLLLALGDGSPRHGYDVGKEIEERSSGRLKPTTGGLYLAIKRLTDQGLVERVSGQEDPPSRRQYFRITRLGKEVAAAEARRLDGLVAVAREKRLFPRSS